MAESSTITMTIGPYEIARDLVTGTSRIIYSNEKENKEMKHEALIKEIDGQIEENRYLRSHNTSYVTYNVLKNNNNLLGKIKTVLRSADNEYNRGAEDAWELARKLVLSKSDGGYDVETQKQIFGFNYSVSDILKGHKTYREALAKVEAYEKKKKEEEEEANIPVIGDVVLCASGVTKFKGILIGETENSYEILTNDEKLAQLVGKDTWLVKKTGKHFDIQGMLDEL